MLDILRRPKKFMSFSKSIFSEGAHSDTELSWYSFISESLRRLLHVTTWVLNPSGVDHLSRIAGHLGCAWLLCDSRQIRSKC